jgi:hypothetical protein
VALTYVASLPLCLLCPSVYLSIGGVGVSLNADLSGNLSLAASFSAQLGISVSAEIAEQIEASLAFSAQLGVAAAFALPVPAFSFSVSDTISLAASLELSLSLLLVLEGLLSANVGIYSFGYEGTGNALGSALTTELATTWPDGAPTSGSCNAFIFGAASSGASVNLSSFLALSFAGGLSYLGKVGLSILSPITSNATAQGEAGINAKLAAAASLSASAGLSFPSFAEMLEAQATFYANLTADLEAAAGISASASVGLAASMAASASLAANFSLLCQLGAVLGAFGETFFVYRYSGPANALGAAVTTALATTWGDGRTSTAGPCTAAILATTDSLAFAAMSGFFGGA